MDRQKIEKMLPISVVSFIKRIIYRFRLLNYYFNDYKTYKKYSFGSNRNQTLPMIRARITLHYHSLEKGLSHPNFRSNFGMNALKNLDQALDDFEKFKYSQTDERYLNAIYTLESYLKRHQDLGIETPFVEKILIKRYKYQDKQANFDSLDTTDSYRVFSKEDLLKNKSSEFELLAKSRISTRDFSNEAIDINSIKRAVDIAVRTPSVCNRQPWKVYYITDLDIKSRVLNHQKGLTKERISNSGNLVIVTTNISYFANDKERNEGFVDGGLFAMSLIYALTSEGLGTCGLHASLSHKDFNKVKEIVRIPENERIIMFIIVGHYEDKILTPLSKRDPADNFLKVIN